ncbi:hypothetical protein H2200_003296 [Cladophialophora chaetospira]|uniref:NADP-dependent oxidoreductase domain-containing protein n=1 Tax=Cladophialophora chaetospira TaxID=386627 RepID=A0AA39CLA8_9EURO|nr:hypothetical protein H2200_003296 [Cladophialophora chaetospira]
MSFTLAGKKIGHVGFGMTSLLRPGKETPREDAIAVMKAALNAGANFWNAGEHYGTPEWNSLHLLNAYFTMYPEDADKVFVSVKGCFDRTTAKPTNDAEGVRASIEYCLKILDGKCHIDLFQASRGDPDVPIEVTIGATAEYVKAGKVGCVGLSECSANTIRRASAVHAVGAVEVELSLFETSNLKNGVADACKEFGIPIIAYSPLSRGFLTGQLQKYEDLDEKDFRRMFPRFQPDVFDENLRLVREVEQIAAQKGCSVVQVALSWVSAQSQVIGVPVVPIPGASAISRVEENMKLVELTKQELKQINEVLGTIEVKGGRYPAAFARYEQV